MTQYLVASSYFSITMASALTVIVLGHAFFGAVPNTFPTAPSSIQIPNITESLDNSTASDRETRRSDYTYTHGIGAHKVHTKAVPWGTAWRICGGEGGYLAIINSLAESKLISRLLEEAGPHEHSNDPNHAHIGFHDLFLKNHWVTLDGQSLEAAGFNEWNDGEPNHLANDERCGSVHKNGRLNDNDCEIKICGFVCELPYVDL